LEGGTAWRRRAGLRPEKRRHTISGQRGRALERLLDEHAEGTDRTDDDPDDGATGVLIPAS
jgi:hypothetical protein